MQKYFKENKIIYCKRIEFVHFCQKDLKFISLIWKLHLQIKFKRLCFIY